MDAPSNPPSRLVPDEPFPGYAFVPGRFPHPTSDPAGHSYGIKPKEPQKLEPEKWYECRDYLYGIDLFNGGYYWESHVAWESLWLQCGRKGLIADFLKALIKLAAAGVKAHEGRTDGVKSHGGRAAELLRQVSRSAKASACMGFQCRELLTLAEEIHQNGWPSNAPRLVPTGSSQSH